MLLGDNLRVPNETLLILKNIIVLKFWTEFKILLIVLY